LKFYMKPLRNLIINIVVNGAVLWFIAYKIPDLWFTVSSIYKVQHTYVVFAILGVIFRFINSVLKNILKILTLPVRIITLGVSSLILNFAILYIFEPVMTRLDLGINVHLGTVVQTAILSVILSAIYFIIKKII